MSYIERKLLEMPFDKAFTMPDGHEELCHTTGLEVKFDGDETWWNEYES